MAKTFKYGAGIWATKTGSSMAYNDQNDNFKPVPFSVTRDSIATRVNKQGLIEVVGHDKLRIDYTDSSNGVALLEPARTNLITFSNDFLDTSWQYYRGTITANATISPDGTLNASKYEEDSQTGGHLFRRQNLSITNGLPYTGSIFVKKGEYNVVRLASNSTSRWGAGAEFSLENGTVTSGTGVIENYGNGWYRCSISGNAAQTTTVAGFEIYTSIGAGIDGDGLFMYGAMFEQGSYPTSYIPSSGSTSQRELDVANGAGNEQVFNDSEGVLFANIAALHDDGTNRRLSISEGLTNDQNRMNMMFTTTSNQIVTNYRAAGTTRVIFNTVLSDVTKYIKVAMLYKSGDFRYFVNGFKIDTDSNTTMISDGTLSELAFEDGTDSNNFYGKTKEIGVYDTVLTDAELEALTSYTSFTNMANELNLTIK
jgi:hypothetical protein